VVSPPRPPLRADASSAVSLSRDCPQLIIYAYRLTRLPRVTPFRRDTLTMKDGGEASTHANAVPHASSQR
jgi:hypothetical protein